MATDINLQHQIIRISCRDVPTQLGLHNFMPTKTYVTWLRRYVNVASMKKLTRVLCSHIMLKCYHINITLSLFYFLIWSVYMVILYLRMMFIRLHNSFISSSSQLTNRNESFCCLICYIIKFSYHKHRPTKICHLNRVLRQRGIKELMKPTSSLRWRVHKAT